MFKVKMIAVGRCKEEWLQEALAEYEKRLAGRLQFEWCLADDNHGLLLLCRKEPHLIALDVGGELLTSESFSEKFIRFGSRATFVIGGPDGLLLEILRQAQWRWSLSPLTFTNQMVRLVVAEQIYRALEIARGSPYHK